MINQLYYSITGKTLSDKEATILDELIEILSNVEIDSPHVRAAMCASAGGSPTTSAFMSTIGALGGTYKGTLELSACMKLWEDIETNSFENLLWEKESANYERFVEFNRAPGFDPAVKTTRADIKHLLNSCDFPLAKHFSSHLNQLETHYKMGLSETGLSAIIFIHLNFTNIQAEHFYLYLRLIAIIPFSIKARNEGIKSVPFNLNIELETDPGPIEMPTMEDIRP